MREGGSGRARQRKRRWALPSSSGQRRHSAFAFLKLAVILRERVADVLESSGCTFEKIAVLSCLAERGQMSHGQLAARVGMDVGNLARLVPIMHRACLIQLEYSERDRRRNVLRIATRGSALLFRVWGDVSRLEIDFLATLTPEDSKIWRDFVVRLLAPHC